MITIHKYRLPVSRVQLNMPRVLQFLDVQIQDGVPTMWALVNTEAPVETKTFLIFPTGVALPNNCVYIGTYQAGWFVGHVFEEI